jgi:hypothetical protein
LEQGLKEQGQQMELHRRAAMLPKSIEGNMYLKKTNAATETKTPTHHGDSTSRFSIDSSFLATKFFSSAKWRL